VTSVLAEAHTSSGNHGYFFVQVAPGNAIKIYSNLDAMAEASTNKPPATWPWVAVGQYAYVKGRYFFDNASSQGIDWTEDDTGSWPYTGYVVICTDATTNCNYYW
jgi:hypothetical protein